MKNSSSDKIYNLGAESNSLRRVVFTGLLLLMLAGSAAIADAQTNFASFDNRSDFDAVSNNLSTIDFESVAPARSFRKYPVDEGLTIDGVNFRTHGGARFGPGMVYVNSEPYAAPNVTRNTGTGANLQWSPPNQPGNAYLEVTLPGGVFAVGADIWTAQPYVSTVEVTFVAADGMTRSITINTRARPAGAFAGFVSEAEIASVRFQIPKGQSGLFLNNFSYGRKKEGANLKSANSIVATPKEEKKSDNKTETPVTRTITEPVPPSPPSAAVRPTRPAAREQTAPTGQNNDSPSAGGTIAYVRGGKEIRLIAPDGTNDRRIWTHEGASEAAGINELAWRPDAKELAFSSGHDAVLSFFQADIYAVKPDGTGLRKLTNAPDYSQFSKYPKGGVTVTVRNEQPIYRQSNASVGIFTVYVAGADMPQQITLAPGASKTLVFKSVADFGEHAQPIVAITGNNRWFMPALDVKAGRMTKAADFGISGDGIPDFGAFRPVWNSDGSRITYRSGLCSINTVSAVETTPGFTSKPLFGENKLSGTCGWDFGPTPALANQIIYQADTNDSDVSVGWNIYRGTAGGRHPGEKIYGTGEEELEFLLDLRWLPDGSGFVYSYSNSIIDSPNGNIALVDLATKKRKRITNFDDQIIGHISVSPDGRWIVFERAQSTDAKTADIWIIGTDGKNLRLLVKNGRNPAWSK